MNSYMKPQNRQTKILSILRAMQQEVHVDDLADMLEVSAITIRRDLDQLAGSQSIIRTHGGCLYAGKTALETEYHQKVRKNFSLKQSIGAEAAALVEDNQSILINDGSTTFHMGAQLDGKKNLSVYTNSLALVTEISRYETISLYVIGGRYDSEQYSLKGFLLEQVIENFNVDKVFIGADSISPDGSCFLGSPEESRLTNMMLNSGREKILLADHTKLDAEKNWKFTSLSVFDKWITTPGIDSSVQKKLAEQTEIIIAD